MSRYRIAWIPGDGIGPEISEATLKVLEKLEDAVGVSLEITQVEAGEDCFKRIGSALPDESVSVIKKSDACLKGPVGEKPMESIVKLRRLFNLYVNLRPVRSYPNVECLRPDIDLVIVRENTEDLYRGLEFDLDGLVVALRVISEQASTRIAEYAFRMAEERNGKKSVVAIHKANVMQRSCGMFARACRKVAEQHKNIEFKEMYVDAAAMNLIRKPHEFDVLVTTNMFGDILSDEAAQLVGGLGMAPSGNIGDSLALFEPVHGSAPDISGRGIANPFSMILSSKMMFEWLSSRYGDAKCRDAAEVIQKVMMATLRDGVKTPDLGGRNSTSEVTAEILKRI